MMASKAETCESFQKLCEKFITLRREALSQGINDAKLTKALSIASPSCSLWRKCQINLQSPAHRLHLLMVVLGICIAGLALTLGSVYDDMVSNPCIIDPNIFSDEICRPRVDCEMCRDIRGVPEERNISSNRFYELYAFSGRPVLVKDAIANWTALSRFSFKYFQNLYKTTEGALDVVDNECQFFPYKTEFLSLSEALNMSDNRAAFKEGEAPWYIGWSNCHHGVGLELRKHYQRPYFLPTDSERVPEDWIFMGGPGRGAGMHLDYVDRPSWQAQISGMKTWQLVPSPECQAVCQSFNVTVHKGDIIVLDTNIWYHATFVHPGEISITIGSEFD